MSEALNHYRVLGVRPNATDDEIKRAYRHLVRTYHPDVSVDKLAAQEKFIEIVAAYQALSDPLERAFYDQKLLHERQRLERERRRQFEESFRRQTTQSLLTVAEIYFLRGQTEQALEHCRRVLKTDPQNAPTFALLGDIYRQLGQFDDATMMYSYAVQYAPGNELYQRRLEQAAAAEPVESQVHQDADAEAERGPERVGLLGICTAVIAIVSLGAAVAYVYLRRDEAPLVLSYVPRVPLLAGPVVGFFAGAAMVLLLWLRPFDDDFYAATLDGASSFGGVPLGLYLAVTGVIWFYLAAAFYVVVSLIEEQVSWSMVKAFGAVLSIVTALALADWQHHVPVLLFCGNGTFLAVLVGWALGSMGRRPW